MPPSLTGPFQVLCGQRFDKPASTAQHQLIARLSSVAQSPATTSGAFKTVGSDCASGRAMPLPVRGDYVCRPSPTTLRSAQKRKQPVERDVEPAGSVLELVSQLGKGLLDLEYAQQPLSRCGIA